jgi:thiamine phosphate synthase YjbQ (UPF0047 family)
VRHARKELWFEVPERRAYLNITPQVEEFVRESGIGNGLCSSTRCTSRPAVYVNDDERGLLQDIDDWLERLPRTSRCRSIGTTTARTTRTRT